MSARLKQISLPVLRLAFVGLVFAVLMRVVDLRDALRVLSGIEPVSVVAAFALFGVGQVMSCIRWRLALTRIVSSPLPLLTLLRLYLIGMFVNLGIPTMTGGDIVRAELMRGLVGGRGGAYASIFVDRLIGFLAVVLVAICATLFAGTVIDGAIRQLVATAALVLVVAVAILVVVLRKFSGTLRVPRLSGFLDALTTLGRHPRIMTASLAIAVAVQLIGVILPIFLLARGMAIELPPAVHLLLVPIIILASLIPLAPNGLGVRETAFVLLYGQFGVAAEPAFALGFAWSIVLTSYGLLGGVVMMVGKRHASQN